MLSASCSYHHPTVNIASIWMHATMESVLALNNKNPNGSGNLGWEGTKSLEHPRARDLCISLLLAKI